MKKNGHKKPRSKRLTPKQEAFLAAFIPLLDQNKESGVEACRIAGFKGSDTSLRVQATRMLANDNVQTEIRKHKFQTTQPIESRIISSHDVLAWMSEVAEGSIALVTNEKGQFDFGKALKNGAHKLIKSITYHKNGKVRSFTMYDAKGANELVGRYYRMWDRSGYAALEDDEEKAKRVLAKLMGCGGDPKLLPPANPNDVEGALVIDEDTKVEMKNEQ